MCWTYACFSFAHRITPILWDNAKRKADDVRSTYRNLNCHGCFTAEEANAAWENELRKERKLSEANDNCILFPPLHLLKGKRVQTNEEKRQRQSMNVCSRTCVFTTCLNAVEESKWLRTTASHWKIAAHMTTEAKVRLLRELSVL